MGNSSSSNSHRIPSSSRTQPSTPGDPHNQSQLKSKKRSIELPDLALLTGSPYRTRNHTPPRSAPIPIAPGSANANTSDPAAPANRFRPQNRLSAIDEDDLVAHHANPRIPFPPPPAQQPNYRSHQDTYYPSSHAAAQARAAQELYNQANAPIQPPPPPPPHPHRHPSPSRQRRSSFVQETVYSSIPIALPQAVENPDDPNASSNILSLVPVKIVWRGGGSSVILIRAGDDDWKGRKPMDRESPSSATYTTTVDLPPGTHHIRFIVDNKVRVADDLPQAVDDQGSLANYVAVPLSYSPPRTSTTPAAQTQTQPPARAGKVVPGQSFWSADSSADSEDIDTGITDAAAATPRPTYTQAQARAATPTHTLHKKPSSASHKSKEPRWTGTLPVELVEAAREEEAYLQASVGYYDGVQGRQHVNGFVPAPNIPPAPGLPRHLDKLILNAKPVSAQNGSSGRRSDRGGPSAATGAAGAGAGGGAQGQGQGAAGANGQVNEMGIGGSTSRSHKRDKGSRSGRKDRHREQRGTPGAGGEKERDALGGIPESFAYQPPPAPPPSEFGDGEEMDLSNVVVVQPTIVEEGTLNGTPGSGPGAGTSGTPTGNGTGTGEKEREMISKLNDIESPALTDDASVLPVPSHVVLHHLSTSAIRNGVLAVATTTRYRKKYLTTVYYKPT
ncbi:hypothetical protein AX16_008315 [Volvariella volvacea WC 439]|nr:hypothetical protein AX16_008315 [Volvariella volvacea WC 439]